MVGLNGTELLPEEQELLLHPGIGGVILFSRNYESPDQLEALTTRLHGLRDPHLLIGVDQEGGRVQRLRNGFTQLPPLRRLGEAFERDPQKALHLGETLGWLMAAELRAVGVDFSFAPVVDIDRNLSSVIGDRALHGDPHTVAKLALAYIRGMQHAGMAATAKHFPGHGAVEADTHADVVIDERPYATIMGEDVLPFRHLIHNGLVAVMAAHVIFKDVDPRPAGFSPFWLGQVLRQDLGFQGVIFSDDLYMSGASVAGGMPDRARAALESGCDMVLLCRPAADKDTADTLDAIPISNDPVSHLRLARMHGRRHADRPRLSHDPAWHQAVEAVRHLIGQQALDLD